MDIFTKDDLAALANQQGKYLMSLYMPTERSGSEVQQNRIRFKNLLDEAKEKAEGLPEEADSLRGQLQALESLEDDNDWWQHQSDALAILLDGKSVKQWRFPGATEPLCVCSKRFHLRPLCRLVQNDGRFYILSVSLNDVRLFLGTKTSVTELEEADLPENLRSALNIDEYVSSLQQHSTSRGNEAMFHGHGGSDLDVKKKDEIKQYFHHIEDALNDYFGVERSPLVFAGVGYLFPLFKGACDYREIVDEPVKGNPDDLSGEELHAKAWPLVKKQFDSRREELLEQYGTAASQDLGSDDLESVLTAAKQGQVGTLLIAEGNYRWDAGERGDPEDGEDLVNQAVVSTLANGGEAYVVEDDQLDKPLAAILRYPIAQTAGS